MLLDSAECPLPTMLRLESEHRCLQKSGSSNRIELAALFMAAEYAQFIVGMCHDARAALSLLLVSDLLEELV